MNTIWKKLLSVAQLVMSIGAYLGCNGIKQLGSKKKKKCWEQLKKPGIYIELKD